MSTFSSLKERMMEWMDKNHPVYESMCKGPFVNVEDILNGHFVHLIECGHLPAEVKPFVINGITAALFYSSKFNKASRKPLYLFFEEAHVVLSSITGEEPLKVNETIFETINREARNYNMYISYLCQSPELLPELIFDNSPLRFIFNIASSEGKSALVSAAGRDPQRLDIDLVKWISRQPDGVCLVRNSKFTRIVDGEFVAVKVIMEYNEDIDDETFRSMLGRSNAAAR
jgi:hypothetical protein